MRVSADRLRVVIDGHELLRDTSFEVASGHVHGIIGPNGSGKSTLLRCIYRSLRPASGAVLLDGDDVWHELNSRQAARRRAVVTQDATVDLEFSVLEMVTMGRAPHKGLFERDTASDASIVREALAAVGMSWAADRLASTLSGGERQRVLLARAIAQQAPVLVLDEPTNHLDIRAQLELLDLVRSLGLTTIAALHELDHAAAICDTVSVLDRGHLVVTGPPAEVLTPQLIRSVFGVQAHIGSHPITGRMHITFAPITSDSTAPAPPSPSEVHRS